MHSCWPVLHLDICAQPRLQSARRQQPRKSLRTVMATAQMTVDSTLNPHVAGVTVSKTMQLSDLATSMKEEGKDVVALASGEPDFDTPLPVIEAGIQAIRDGHTHYTPNIGTSAIRNAIVKKLRDENGLEYQPTEIVVSNGAKQCILQSILAVSSPGDEVLVPAPYWVSYASIPTIAGAKAKFIETKLEDGFLLTAADLEKSLSAKSRVLIICTPSNPTGAVYSKQQLQEIAAVVAKHPRLLIISDEIYEHIIYAPAKHYSFAALPGMRDRTITVNGFSKAFAMTGWRLGYLAAPSHYAKAVAVVQSQNTSGASSIAQQAGIAALALGKAGGKEVAAMVDKFQERRDFLLKRLDAIDGLKTLKPGGAFYAFPDVSAFFGAGVKAKNFGPIPDSDTLCRYLLEQHLVALVPGDAFGAADCLRISYAVSLQVLKKALDRLEVALSPENLTRQ